MKNLPHPCNDEGGGHIATEEKGYVKDFRAFLLSHSQEEVDKYFSKTLQELYGSATARALSFLLGHVDRPVKLRFAHTYMVPETLACHVSSDIVVEAAGQEERVSPNIGRYVISVRSSDGTKVPLRFSYQVSAVYYMMHLIERKKKGGDLPVIDLFRNKESFVFLYHAIYDNITHTAAQQRHQQLLYRVSDGRFQAGYKSTVECDIRRQLSRAFSRIGDSPIPYGMSSRRHLAVGPERIVFEGEARRLLTLQFT